MLSSALRLVWPLLFGIGLLMLGNGLQGTLLGLRAELEGFGRAVTGVVMAGFFAGFLLGSIWTPRAVRTVGYVRVFAALSAVASASILAHALVVDALTWGLIRVLTGFCFAGIFVIAESWLNDRAPNAARGQLLAVYMALSFAGMGGGQFLLNVADPQAPDLFILVSILISLAVVPLLLSATPLPGVDVPRPVPLRRLFSASPLGTVGTFTAGIANGTIFGMGAVYAGALGLSVARIALFMGLLIAGAAVLQWPIGKLSDVVDRRRVIVGVTFLAAVAALVSDRVAGAEGTGPLLVIAIFGGLSLSVHSLSLAYTNDYLEQDELMAASSGLVLVLGVGSVLGPVLAGSAIALFGPSGFFYWLAGAHVALGAFAVWRMTQREALPEGEQVPYVAAPLQGPEMATGLPDDAADAASATVPGAEHGEPRERDV